MLTRLYDLSVVWNIILNLKRCKNKTFPKTHYQIVIELLLVMTIYMHTVTQCYILRFPDTHDTNQI